VPGKRKTKIRKSHEIVLGVAMFSVVASVTGCDDSTQPRRCVDGNGKVVSEEQCQNDETRRYYGGGPPVFFWYYGGGGGYATGSFANGGSFTPPRGYSTAPHGSGGGRFSTSPRGAPSGSGALGGSVGRGGFGGSAAAHGGGGIGG
jgi:hypothetical protein